MCPRAKTPAESHTPSSSSHPAGSTITLRVRDVSRLEIPSGAACHESHLLSYHYLRPRCRSPVSSLCHEKIGERRAKPGVGQMPPKIRTKLVSRCRVRRDQTQILRPDPQLCLNLLLQLHKIWHPVVFKNLNFELPIYFPNHSPAKCRQHRFRSYPIRHQNGQTP